MNKGPAMLKFKMLSKSEQREKVVESSKCPVVKSTHHPVLNLTRQVFKPLARMASRDHGSIILFGTVLLKMVITQPYLKTP